MYFHDVDPLDDDTRPVVALDVDGVLRPVGWPWIAPTSDPATHTPWKDVDALPGYEFHEVDVPRDDIPNSPFHHIPTPEHGPGSDTVRFAAWLNPIHGEWIRSLLTRCDVVWATTWEASANHLTPLIGAPSLPVGISVSVNPPGARVLDWKLGALDDNFAHRAVSWVDDLISGSLHTSDLADRGWDAWRAGMLAEHAERHPGESMEPWFRRFDDKLADLGMVRDADGFPPYEFLLRETSFSSRAAVWRRTVDGCDYPAHIHPLPDGVDAEKFATAPIVRRLTGPRQRVGTRTNQGLTRAEMDRIDAWVDAVLAGTLML